MGPGGLGVHRGLGDLTLDETTVNHLLELVSVVLFDLDLVLQQNIPGLLQLDLQLWGLHVGVLTALTLPSQQILEALAIQLDHGHRYIVFQLLEVPIPQPEHFLRQPGNDTGLTPVGLTGHGVGFTLTRLPVSENGDVVTINLRLHQILTILKDFLLRTGRPDGVEDEVTATFLLNSHGIDTKHSLVVTKIDLPLRNGPHTHEDPNASLNILDLVVDSLPPGVDLIELDLFNTGVTPLLHALTDFGFPLLQDRNVGVNVQKVFESLSFL